MGNKIEKGYTPFIDLEHFMTPIEKRKEFKNLDFEKANQIIEKEKEKIDYVIGGLAEDWGYTQGTIFIDGKYVKKADEYESPYFSSYWATPAIEINYKNGKSKMIECYKASTRCIPNIPKWWIKNNKFKDLNKR